MPSTTAIIQARTGSSRLPGKVLADVGGQSMLGRVVERVRQAGRVGRVLVATSTEPADQAVVEECRRLEVECFRGDENDVLDRYYRAAAQVGAGVVVRITADCPLIDPEVIDQVVGAFLDRSDRLDFAANTLYRTYPRGLDTEVMSMRALGVAWREAREPYERVHVTPYFYRHPERFRTLSVLRRDGWEDLAGKERPDPATTRLDSLAAGDYERIRTGESTGVDLFRSSRSEEGTVVRSARVASSPDLSEWRWTVDAPPDLEFVRAVYRRWEGCSRFSWRDVCRLLLQEPHLLVLNRDVRQKTWEEG